MKSQEIETTTIMEQEQLSTRLRRCSKRLLAKMSLRVHYKSSTWSELPRELLELIADGLELEELLGFRSVCKNWRSATSYIVDRTNSIEDQKPWFLLYGNNSSSCQLQNSLTGKLHTIHIPELEEDSYCIASGQGWLLLLYRDGSVFFFCPFSRAKICLPRFIDHEEEEEGELSNHYVGAFTSVPASSDCTVWIISQCHTNKQSVKVSFLRRGDDKWTKYEYNSSNLSLIMSATIGNGTLYFLDSTDKVLTFSSTNEINKWKGYDIVTEVTATKWAHTLPFSYDREYLSEKDKRKLGLDESDSVSICGTVLHRGSIPRCIHNQDIKAEEGKELRRTKGVWIQPLFQLPSNQSWSL